MIFPDLLTKKDFNRDDIVAILSAVDKNDIEIIRQAAEKVLLENCGNGVYLRGLIEVSNVCCCDCYYCGIRKSFRETIRYTLDLAEIVETAKEIVKLGYGSMVMQSGERRDRKFIDMMVEAVKIIKEETKSDVLPEGLGITLSLGEHNRSVLEKFFDAGAHRYLLRIETSNPELFAKLHPSDQSFESRVACLNDLRNVGYQVGTGVMIGLPYQTLNDLANDIIFFRDNDIDMIGMGPFIPSENTPLYKETCKTSEERVRLGLLMIAATRLVLRDVNIASTTALQALDVEGREKGLMFGANVIMPLMTPLNIRENYQLYPGKPFIKEDYAAGHETIQKLAKSAGRIIGENSWGDSVHAKKRYLK